MLTGHISLLESLSSVGNVHITIFLFSLNSIVVFLSFSIVHQYCYPYMHDDDNKHTNTHKTVKMYIGNLSFYTTKDVLTGVFEEFGKVYDCYLPTDPNTDKPRGYAFITMEREAGQEAISELDGLEIDGRFIRVSESQAKKPSRRNYSNDDDGDDF